MSLGEIPAGGLRAYYHLENVNDSGGNGFTLTNNNSVTFPAGKFNNGAEFGTTGTNKGLTTTTLILSSKTPTNVVFSFWVKFNTTTVNNPAILFGINTDVSSAAGGMLLQIRYSFNVGVVTLNARYNITTTGDCEVMFTPVIGQWYHVYLQKAGSTIKLIVDNDSTKTDTGTAGGGYSG